MKQIKTVQYQCDNYENFDKEVNGLLLDGWELKERFVMQPYDAQTTLFRRMYVAYLEKEV